MKVLILSDTIIPFIYSPQARQRFNDIELIIGCGDLPYFYLEYVFNGLNIPLIYVRGNHDKIVEYSSVLQRTGPAGGIDLHQRCIRQNSRLIAGVEGSLRYRPGPFQYSQEEMWTYVFGLVPRLLLNRMLYGRFLDIFVSHSPPAGIHDMSDLPHRGVRAFTWLLRVFQPEYHFHGHVHIYRPDTARETLFGKTKVINAYGFQEIIMDDGYEPGPLSFIKRTGR